MHGLPGITAKGKSCENHRAEFLSKWLQGAKKKENKKKKSSLCPVFLWGGKKMFVKQDCRYHLPLLSGVN